MLELKINEKYIFRLFNSLSKTRQVCDTGTRKFRDKKKKKNECHFSGLFFPHSSALLKREKMTSCKTS